MGTESKEFDVPVTVNSVVSGMKYIDSTDKQKIAEHRKQMLRFSKLTQTGNGQLSDTNQSSNEQVRASSSSNNLQLGTSSTFASEVECKDQGPWDMVDSDLPSELECKSI